MLSTERARVTLEGSVEDSRKKLFSGRSRPGDEYDEPRSEISAFLEVLPPDILGAGGVQRPEQYSDAHRLIFHAAGL